MSDVHAAVVRRAFAGQAAAFEDPARGFGSVEALSWVTAATPLRPDDLVLEVAAGTALVGRALAPLVRAVVAVDLSPEMLTAGREAAIATGLRNVIFQVGDSTALPFLDGTFDRVVCRLALHHHEDAGPALAEMVRACRPGGTLTVVDLVADGATRRTFDDLERRRDPSHTRALTRDELHRGVTDAGARIIHADGRDRVLVGEPWLAQTSTAADDADHVRAAWEAELAGGPPTGMRPRRGAGGVELVHRWELVVAEVG
jgi:SAM-dependent methyltransferase